jgi:hypothetical protein
MQIVIVLVFVVWWTVAAQSRDRVTTAPGPAQPTTPPIEQASLVREQPVVVQPTAPVDVYVERGTTPPVVYVMPKGRKPHAPMDRLSRVNLPTAFKYRNMTWVPSGEAVTASDAKLMDIGVAVDGNLVYADQEARPPHKSFYLETSPGSGVFIAYRAVDR